VTPVIVCPIDFSEASRGALRYGLAIAGHFGSTLLVVTVNDPLLAEAAAIHSSTERVIRDTEDALREFFAETAGARPDGASRVVFEVRTGKPAEGILEAAHARAADLIVISSHGLTGFRKMFFGSTTERVLRETRVPVLVVPGTDRGPERGLSAHVHVRRVLVPVLLPAATPRQLAVARGLADALGAAALLLHVVEPVRAAVLYDRYLPSIERERRMRAESDLDALVRDFGGRRAEGLIAYGEPAEEIVKVAEDRDADLIVMSLSGSPLTGPRIGSVTYRVLSAAGRLVIALPMGDFTQRREKAAGADSVEKARS
jgi:nucleotide-binding universal stress UspA family protein